MNSDSEQCHESILGWVHRCTPNGPWLCAHCARTAPRLRARCSVVARAGLYRGAQGTVSQAMLYRVVVVSLRARARWRAVSLRARARWRAVSLRARARWRAVSRHKAVSQAPSGHDTKKLYRDPTLTAHIARCVMLALGSIAGHVAVRCCRVAALYLSLATMYRDPKLPPHLRYKILYCDNLPGQAMCMRATAHPACKPAVSWPCCGRIANPAVHQPNRVVAPLAAPRLASQPCVTIQSIVS